MYKAATAVWVGVTATGKASRGSFSGAPHRPVRSGPVRSESQEIIPRKELQNVSSNCRLMTSDTLLQTDAQNIYRSIPAPY
jgi:hypothetical protein